MQNEIYSSNSVGGNVQQQGKEKEEDALSYVNVRVRGDVTIPLKLKLLQSLGDNDLAEKITREAIKIGVSEHLGYFDELNVQLRTNALETTNSTGNQNNLNVVADVEVDLCKLGKCISAIQTVYNEMRCSAELLRELLQQKCANANAKNNNKCDNQMSENNEFVENANSVNQVRKDQCEKENVTDDLLLKLVEEMLAGPRDMTARAEAIAKSSGEATSGINNTNTDDDNIKNNNTDDEKIGLLAKEVTDIEDEEYYQEEDEYKNETELNNESDNIDADDIDESVYEQLGYMRL